MKTKEEKWKDEQVLAGFLTTVIPKAETAASSLREEESKEKLPPLNRTGTKKPQQHSVILVQFDIDTSFGA